MPRTVEDLVAEARSRIREISLEDLVDTLAGDLVLVDVREPDEYAQGHLPGAVNLPRGVLEFQIHAHPAMACVADAALAEPSRRMVLYCRTGGRSALAADRPAAVGLHRRVFACRRLRGVAQCRPVREHGMTMAPKKTKTAKAANIAFDMEAMRAHAGDAARLLKALANEKRLQVLCLLAEGERSVGEINSMLDLSQSALSQHLAVLREEGLVQTRREAQVIYYSLMPGPAAQVMQTLHGIYCSPAPARAKKKGAA